MALAQLIQIEKLLTQLDDKNTFILDCRFSLDNPQYGEQAYQKAHIPNALFIDLDKDLSSSVIKGVTSRHPLPNPKQLTQRLAELGLNNDSKIILYDDGPTPYATRMWWSLIWLGKRDNIFILDGGFSAWQHANAPTTTEVPSYPEGNFTGEPDNSLIIYANQVEKKLGDPNITLLDARALPRFKGDIEPIDPVAGHIPGAICADFTQNLDSTGHYLPANKLRERFNTLLQNRPTSGIIAYCGSGVSACQNLFAMCLIGYPLVPLYAGSWSEWITNPKRPIAKGE